MLKAITLKTIITTTAILVFGSTAALAHVTLEGKDAPVGSTYKAVLRVPHGCEGKPTNTVRVQIPEGFYGVKPQPKAGWTLDKVKGAYAKAYDNHGSPVTEGVKEVVWSGGNLGDDEYDEFVLRGTIAADLKAGDMLYFPVIQECPEGLKERWIEVPAAGQKASDLELPAPGVKLLQKTGN
ncbi:MULTISPECIES: YcnI family protein [unclassified Neorhizobium]|uniref:YcnI family copper-binding membrane protein n=1 Tax=unclassified Neorhizobium TaxID=2629175 RepID=UPI001FF1F581|nr:MULTISPECIES: YcnI family protein [unclassified Neorhizobium]MCJ9669955.1 YcnI family protein [Neorhizobium sp. SHOUNA12B]MCJ9744772.1 YcnI family protein [Neorhizobium sp. SHOUNA12A]